jgi:recombination DNA repair RAD52 pathway protein
MDDSQKKLLAADLDKKYVKAREQGGRSFSYIEAWHVIAEANRIFGFDGWKRSTVYCNEVARYQVERKNKDGTVMKDAQGNIVYNWKVGYEAKVRIHVGDVVREGTGHGNGTMGDLYDAIESAAKEAETDAMKRAFMTFGNPFGLALYDKTQSNVSSAPRIMPEDQKAALVKAINDAQTESAVTAEYAKAAQAADAVGNDLLREEFKKLAKDRKAIIKSYQQSAQAAE